MPTPISFSDLELNSDLLQSLSDLGYETPTPIQERSIPVLLNGQDLLAQAQTGTGKTAAFALPILSKVDVSLKQPQALIVAPTRELAIQVAEAFQSYARHMKGFSVMSIYGGQDYSIQLKGLRRGAHVIVGTPGRLMDHMRRGSLNCSEIKTLVLDEADEMLKMGFVDDVSWIIEQIEGPHQTALFSATVPESIKKIANNYLNNPEKINIQSKVGNVDNIEQVFLRINRNQKIEALTRMLEIEKVDAAIIFVGTKNMSTELAEKLQGRGKAAAALNGDINQSLRTKTIERLKGGSLDILVATDVAARGIDVDRVTHVFNYDIPYDTEAYVHRIGRTGRAGRAGKAILFLTPREQGLFKNIERAIKKKITQIEPPSVEELQEKRNTELFEEIQFTIDKKAKKLFRYYELIDNLLENSDFELRDVAAAMAYLKQKGNPLPTGEIHTAAPEEYRGGGGRRSRDRGRGGRSSERGRSDRSGGGHRSGGGGRSSFRDKPFNSTHKPFKKAAPKRRSKQDA